MEKIEIQSIYIAEHYDLLRWGYPHHTVTMIIRGQGFNSTPMGWNEAEALKREIENHLEREKQEQGDE